MIKQRRANCRIDLVCEALSVSQESVRNAARIHNVPLWGGFLGCPPEKLQLDFLRTIHEENSALTAQAERRNATGTNR